MRLINLPLLDGTLGRVTTPKKKLMIAPHLEAPMFHRRKDAMKVIDELYDEMLSGNFPTTERFRDIVRQAALSSLWFYTKVVCAYGGQYESLNADLHIEMTNFYQVTDHPGTQAAIFVPRLHFKTSSCTEAGNSWTIVREPMIAIGLGSGIFDRAQEMMWAIQRIHDSNELHRWIFPETYPKGKDVRWNNDVMETPARRGRYRREPTLKPFTVGGSLQSLHFDRLHLDDIVGEQELNAMKESNAEMFRRKEWMRTNILTLSSDWRNLRVFFVGTRYAGDDVYEPIMTDVKETSGYWEELQYEPHENGSWKVYYRQAREPMSSRNVIFPQRITNEQLDKMLEDDPWGYYTQMMNNPHKSGIAEFSDFDAKPCYLDWSHEMQDFHITFTEETVMGTNWEILPLSWCDVGIYVDPKGTERDSRISRTSRAVAVVMALDPKGRQFVIDGRVGSMGTLELMDVMFELHQKFRPYIRRTGMELQGPFKALEPVLRREQNQRNYFLNLVPITATIKKEVRIRNELQPLMTREQLFIVKNLMPYFDEERRVFPNGMKMDVLDAIAIGTKAGIRPKWPEEVEEEEEIDEIEQLQRNPVTGY